MRSEHTAPVSAGLKVAALLVFFGCAAVEHFPEHEVWKSVPLQVNALGVMIPTSCLSSKDNPCTHEIANSLSVTKERRVTLTYHLKSDTSKREYLAQALTDNYLSRGALDSAKSYAVWFRSESSAGSIELKSYPPNRWLRSLADGSLVRCNNRSNAFSDQDGCVLLGPLNIGSKEHPVIVDAFFVLPESSRDAAEAQ